jgi:annexin A7/11
MEDALLFQLRNAVDKYMHQATLLEDAMAGAGTKDYLLVSRVVRYRMFLPVSSLSLSSRRIG